ncbi:MAG: NAD(P)/FAD-dependent oxidoreductase, partial [Myxococcales bacterium]|nr:NAD(P)/FAD-dependent oxidoreductase [Myxococcales bacterium]
MLKTSCSSTYDVIIVGARCAGAATAMLLARSGYNVLVLERGKEGTDTLSTLALMRPAVMQLHRWGLLPRVVAGGTPAVAETSFFYPGTSLCVDIGERGGVSTLFAPRRTLLDPIICDGAREAGATVLHETRVLDLLRDGERVVGVRTQDRAGNQRDYRAPLVVGADGRKSMVARLAGAEVLREGAYATGVQYGYFAGLPSRGFEWHFGHDVSGGLIPTNDGLTLAFAACSRERYLRDVAPDTAAGFLTILDEMGDLGERVRNSRAASKLYGAAGFQSTVRKPYGPGWALVGDAGYFRDPITAQGISDALRDAELLARAIARGGAFAEY